MHMPSAFRFDHIISVDVETAGPNPGRYALLSIGACTLTDPRHTFYVEIQPSSRDFIPEALAVHGLSLETLAVRGLPPSEAMQSLADWLGVVVPAGRHPQFLAFNAPFDWMFVCDYFYRYLGYNPFGHTAIDIKAYTMGKTGLSWEETSWQKISGRYLGSRQLAHHALQDALDQAEIFQKIFSEA
jgi:DNA polymerase III epsilon subunit-like protein